MLDWLTAHSLAPTPRWFNFDFVMNVFTNEDFFNSQLRAARRQQLIGIGIIVAFLILNCALQFGLIGLPPVIVLIIYLLGYVAVLIGFPLWTIGNNKLKKLRSAPRSDQLLNEELKGLSNKFTLHHYVPMGGGIIKHLLVTPSGLVVMESRDDIGKVNCTSSDDGDHWKLPGGFLMRFMGDGVSTRNPSADLEAAMGRADSLLSTIGKPNVPINGFIVFTRQNDLEIESSSRRAIPLDETKALVKAVVFETENDRSGEGGVTQMLTSDDRRRLNALLVPTPPPAVPTKPTNAAPRNA